MFYYHNGWLLVLRLLHWVCSWISLWISFNVLEWWQILFHQMLKQCHHCSLFSPCTDARLPNNHNPDNEVVEPQSFAHKRPSDCPHWSYHRPVHLFIPWKPYCHCLASLRNVVPIYAIVWPYNIDNSPVGFTAWDCWIHLVKWKKIYSFTICWRLYCKCR